LADDTNQSSCPGSLLETRWASLFFEILFEMACGAV
jgi:hypothetical protein